MARTRTAERPKVPADPYQARREVIDRVLARRPEPRTRTYPNAGPRGESMQVTEPPDTDRLPAKTLGDWIDDRIMAALGSRVALNPGEAAYLAILEAMRTGEAETVRAAVRDAARRGLSDLQAPALNMALEEMRGKAPGFAYDLALTAVTEARRSGWDRIPEKMRRHITVAGRDE